MNAISDDIISVTKTFQLKNSKLSVRFIVMHKDVIYVGDYEYIEIIVIKDSIIQYILLDSAPLSGIIISIRDQLAVGCYNGCVYMIDLLTHAITQAIQF